MTLGSVKRNTFLWRYTVFCLWHIVHVILISKFDVEGNAKAMLDLIIRIKKKNIYLFHFTLSFILSHFGYKYSAKENLLCMMADLCHVVFSLSGCQAKTQN